MSKEERTGWRDEGISRLHRTWGHDCPCVDIDFLVVEYNQAKACAIVEYKNENSVFDFWSASTRALKDLADRAQIAFISCRYADNYTWFKPGPRNDIAKMLLPDEMRLTQPEWISLLHRLRGLASNP